MKERNAYRVKLDVIINAPLVVLPTGTAGDNSTDIFVINLGQLNASNKFIMASDYSNEIDKSQLISSSGQPAVMEKLSVKVTSIKFYKYVMIFSVIAILQRYHRVKSFESIENMSDKRVLVKLLECSAELTRSLSPWCKPLPLTDISVLLDTIYVSPFI